MINDNKDNDSSFFNYVTDTWVRSLECRDWIRRFEPFELSHGWSPKQLEELWSLYSQIRDYLTSRVMLVDANEPHLPEMVSFHQRYGWVLASKRAKSYLGKVAIPEDMPIEVGRQSYISGQSTLRGKHKLVIGSFTAIAEGLYLNTSQDMHPTEYASMINFKTERRCLEDGLAMDISYQQLEKQQTGIQIGSDVWIGRDVRIFHGANIAHGSVIAERSLLRGQTEPYGIYAGVPAKLKRFRFSDSVISELLNIRWWEWPRDRLLRNKDFFATNISKPGSNVLNLIKD